MTTKELQEYWRAVKSQRKPVKLLFEIPSTRTVEHYPSRYVVRIPSFYQCQTITKYNGRVNTAVTPVQIGV